MKETSVNLPAGRKAGWVELSLLGIILASHLPFLVAQFDSLWQGKPHYQFFPLFLAAIGFLLWQRWPVDGLRFRDSRLALCLVLLGLATLAAGVLVFYPWLGAVAFLLTLCGLVAGLEGRQVRRDLLPVCLLLIFVIPPPLNWDENIVRWMQLATSQASSLALDVFGVRHLMEGNVLVLPGHRLFVEEACSGVSSLFTLLSATACLLVFVRRPAVWSALLLAAGIFWAGVANTARVVTIALGPVHDDFDLSKGWQHEAIGLIAVSLALLMVVSSDRLLAFVLRPIVPPDGQPLENPLSRCWNALLGGGDPTPRLSEDEQGVTVTTSSPRLLGEGQGVRVTTAVLAGSFLLLGILQGVGLASAAAQLKQQSAATELLHRPNLFVKTDLPATIAGWSQVKFEAQDFDPKRQIGAILQTWTLQSGKVQCAISADYPIWWGHDLSGCYVANGWSVIESAQRRADPESPNSPELYIEADLLGQNGEHGLLLFSVIDQAGHVFDVPQHLTWRRVMAKAAWNPLWSRALPTETLEALQVQAFISTPDPLSDTQRQNVRDLFTAARQKLISEYVSKIHHATDPAPLER